MRIMRRPVRGKVKGWGSPHAEQCIAHRCDRHEQVPTLNREDNGTECGACIAEEMLAFKAQLLLVLDGYAERLEFAHQLQREVESLRAQLRLATGRL